MREILFRGKRIDNGEWVESGNVFLDGKKKHIYIPNPDTDMRAKAYRCVEVIPETIGQYTGLTDKNGKRIFEGDILKDDWGKIFEVIFTTSSCGFMVECIIAPSEFETGRYRIGDVWCNTISVIGNIYDNPELLKGVQE